MPATVDELAASVKVDLADPPADGVTGFVENVLVKPDGAPRIDKVTGELKPFSEFTVAVALPEAPCGTVSELGDMDTEKSGAVIVSVTVIV